MEYDQLNIVLRNNSQRVMEMTMMMIIMMMEQLGCVWRGGAPVTDCRLGSRSGQVQTRALVIRFNLFFVTFGQFHFSKFGSNAIYDC